jgi:hypothetical protein
MASYVVMLREDPAVFSRLSPTEMQAIIQRYYAWFGKLAASGRLEVGRKLKDNGGKHLRAGKGKMLVSDGPYAEAKDVVSGLFIVSAASYEEAQSLLSDCPHFDYGWFEVREVDVTG